jgi:hypothetical protein
MGSGGMAIDTMRVLVVSVRGFRFQAANCCLYELEDLLAQMESADMHTPTSAFSLSSKVYRAAKYLSRSDELAARLSPFPEELVLQQDYDLLLVVLDNPWRMQVLKSITGWRERCAVKACFIAELWTPDLDNWRLMQEPWNDFDHVFLGVNSTVNGLNKLIAPPVSYVPPAVDALRFSPYPNPPARSIDVAYVGRRSPIIHDAVLERAWAHDFFYYYDTIKGTLEVEDHRAHRQLLAKILQRSRYTICNYAKFNRTNQTAGDQEIGYRFFEGAAAGTVMIGTPPEGEAFSRYFDWEDAIIKAEISGPRILEVIAELDGQPERIDRLRRANVTNSLLKHDWVYRWRDMLSTLGLEPGPGAAKRERSLRDLANIVSTQPQN